MLNNLGIRCLILFFFSIKVCMRIYTSSNIIKFLLQINQSSYISFPFFQVDLEPEGKVFVVISLTGNFTEGKGVALACFHSELDWSVPAISSRAVQTLGFFML